MYAIGDKFKPNYDDSTWTIMRTTMVISNDSLDDSLVLEPGYVVSILDGQKTELATVSHELISQGIEREKLKKI